MSHTKTFRNIVFTIIVLALTALAIRWNKEIAATRNPVSIGSSVLAEEKQLASVNNDFPINLELSRPTLKLGQIQLVTIKTGQFADLEVLTVYPDGKYDRQETFNAQADEVGNFSFKFQPNSFRFLGKFQVIVKAKLVDNVAYAQASFVQQTWNEEKENQFIYPLLP